LLQYPGHVIATMRSRTEWTVQQDKNGRVRPVRVGLAPEQRRGVEYEFDLVGLVHPSHETEFIKDRTGKYQDVVRVIDEDFGRELRAWLEQGEAPAPRQDLTENGKQPEPRLGPEPKAEPVQSAEPVQAPERPMSPEALRTWLREQAAALYYQNFRFNNRSGAVGLLVRALEDVLGSEEQRRVLLQWLFGKPSTKELGDHTLKALMDWLNIQKNEEGQYEVTGPARVEANMAYAQAMREEGQQDLPLEEMQAEMNRALFGEV